MDRLKKITHWQNSVPHTATFKEKKKKKEESYYLLEKVYYGAYGHDKLSAMYVIMAQW